MSGCWGDGEGSGWKSVVVGCGASRERISIYDDDERYQGEGLRLGEKKRLEGVLLGGLPRVS